MDDLCWFQTSLLQARLLLHHVITLHLLFQSYSSHASGPPRWLFHWAALLSSWIELNCQWYAAVGKTGGLSINWQDAAYCLVFHLWQIALSQLYKYHHQSGNVMSSKLVWKQLYCTPEHFVCSFISTHYDINIDMICLPKLNYTVTLLRKVYFLLQSGAGEQGLS